MTWPCSCTGLLKIRVQIWLLLQTNCEVIESENAELGAAASGVCAERDSSESGISE